MAALLSPTSPGVAQPPMADLAPPVSRDLWRGKPFLAVAGPPRPVRLAGRLRGGCGPVRGAAGGLACAGAGGCDEHGADGGELQVDAGRSGSRFVGVPVIGGLSGGVVEGAEEALQGAYFGAEGVPAFAGDLDPGARAAAAGGLVLADEAGFLQGLKVAAEVAVGYPEGGLEVGEVCFRHSMQRGEDPESHALVDVVVDVMDGVLVHRAIIAEAARSTVA